MSSGAFSPRQCRDFLERGFSRRDLGRLAALLAAGAALPGSYEAAHAQGLSALRNLPPDAVLLNANENPLGPCREALEAIQAIAPRGGRYLYDETFRFVEAMAESEELPVPYVLPFAGSSDALHRSVLAFTSPTRGYVTADPGYEAGERAATFIGSKVTRVPLREDGSHDVQAMAQADPSAGVIYVCNPNNPSGSVTSKEDIEYLVANKPEGTIVLLDEAYIHLAHSTGACTHLVAADKDVVILRTFSKIYGMAGLRAGAALARPDLLLKLKGYGAGAMPVTGMVGATASLKARDIVPRRRQQVAEIRGDILSWLGRQGYATLPTESNKFMVDVRRPGMDVFKAMLAEKVVIGRTWPSMPNHVRVSIGTREEMAKFKAAFAKVMSA